MKPLSIIKTQKNSLLKNLVFVVLLSSGVSLIVNTLTNDSFNLAGFITGIVFVLGVSVYYFVEFFHYSSCEVCLDSIMAIDEQNKVIPINRFGFSEDLYHVVSSVCTENQAYEVLWNEAFGINNTKGKEFIVEFLEYLFIKQLSLNLNTYFSSFNKRSIEIIEREQIPDVLIQNRVLEMISKSYKEREKFINTTVPNANKGTVVSIRGHNGVFYDRLQIMLPRKTRLSIEGNTVVIKNRNFIIRFEAAFDGFMSTIPRYFAHLYMNRSWENTRIFQVKLKMSIELKPLFLLSFRDWQYLGWLDQLENRVQEYFSFDAFLKRVGFEGALSSHIMYLNSLNSKVASKKNDLYGL